MAALKGSQLAMHEGVEKKYCDPFRMAPAAFLGESGGFGDVWGCPAGILGWLWAWDRVWGSFFFVAIIFSFVGVGTVVAFFLRFPRTKSFAKKKKQKKRTDQKKAHASSLRIGGVLFKILKPYPLNP